MNSTTRKKRGKWICKGLRSESRDKNGNVFHVMDECHFKEDYDVSNILNQRIRFNPTVGSPRSSTRRRYQSEQLSPRYSRPSPSKLLEKRHQLRRVTPKRRKKYDEDVVITPKDNDPIWLYANYTGMIKDYDGNNVRVAMYSERRD
jgi:hypothetical protein